MSIRKQQFTAFPITNSNSFWGISGRFFLTLLVFAGFSVLSVAQERYTVDRPVITPVIGELPVERPPRSVRWETDYEYARLVADISARYLLIYLYTEQDLPENPNEDHVPLPIATACREFDLAVLDDDHVLSGLDRHVLLKMPRDSKVTGEDGVEVPILSLPGFEHMAGYPGLVVIDFAHRDTPHCGQVTGILPFWQAVCPTAEQTAIFLDLPPGTLSQRTLTYAVRIHPDKPLSSGGEPLPLVVQVATNHALYQAERGILGHQNFGRRSRDVIEILGGGMPSEICAQSRNLDSIYEAAIACMRLWRYSSGHWAIARKSHRYYGYDMVRGKNGAWFAVGFFID